MKNFKEGDYVQYGIVATIVTEILYDSYKLKNGVICSTDDIMPVLIGGGFDKGIVLDCIIPPRAKISLNSSTKPLMIKPSYYLDNVIDDYPLKLIVKDNDLKYVHELQEWLRKNKPDFRLISY